METFLKNLLLTSSRLLKKLLQSLATLTLFGIILVSNVMASAKMEVPLGETVSLQAEAIQGGSNYKWVVTKDGQIQSTQSGSAFSYTFDRQGEHKVTLSAEDASDKVKTTSVYIMVGDRYSKVDSTGSSSSSQGSLGGATVAAGANTLPILSSDKEVHILGDEGRVVFDITTHPNILEYRVDRNIFVDSDGNGVANDDIDNQSDRSYLVGGIYETTYKASESNKIAAEITVVDTLGQKSKQQIAVIFDDFIQSDGSVVAILDSLPMMGDDKKIHVYDDQDTVAFYARRSQGEIVEYRIDKNIFVDSDGDGNPANDIDNRDDSSFRSGDVWTTDYVKTGQQIIAQLIVVGEGGTGSRIQREVIFSNRPAPAEVTPGASGDIFLMADKDFVQVGDPIGFSVEGLTQALDSYTFEWDFDGDGEFDQSVEGLNTVSFIYDLPGISPVSVHVMDQDGNEATFNMDLLVKDIDSTEANFDFVIDGDTVDFTNLSTVSANLSNKVLAYTWSFGDTDEQNYQNQQSKIGIESPSYTYTKPGTYVVSLTVVDSDQVQSTKTAEVVIGEDAVAATTDDGEAVQEEAPKGESSGSLLGTIFKWVLYIVLTIVFLILLMVVGLMTFLKVQHPDLVFEELLDEVKIKLLGMMGVHEDEALHPDEPVAPAPVAPKPDESKPKLEPTPAPTPTPTPKPAPTPTPKAAAEPDVDLSKSDAPMPDWLKPKSEQAAPAPKKDVIEGEVVEEKPAPQTPKPEAPKAPKPEAPKPDKPDTPAAGGNQNLSGNDGPVPDWLKKS